MTDSHFKVLEETIFLFLLQNPDDEFTGAEIFRTLQPPCTQWTLYYYLKRLVGAGLIVYRKRGAANFYRLAEPPEGAE